MRDSLVTRQQKKSTVRKSRTRTFPDGTRKVTFFELPYPKHLLKAIFNLKGYSYFLRLFYKVFENTLSNKHSITFGFLVSEVIFRLVRLFPKTALKYPLARNQYINNSPGVVSCFRAGANTGATCIRTELNSFKNLAILPKMIPQKYFPVFTRERIQAPHVFERKLIPPEIFPACIGFVPGGMCFFLARPSLQSLAVKKSFIFCKCWVVKTF